MLVPYADLSLEWNWVGLLAFPEVPNRKKFCEIGVREENIKFILTAEELSSDLWLEDLALTQHNAAEDEYLNLLAFIVGSNHVCYSSQVTIRMIPEKQQKGFLVNERLGALQA